MIRTDCFAYRKEKNECNALNEMYCKKEKCKFYKTREQIIKEQYIEKTNDDIVYMKKEIR